MPATYREEVDSQFDHLISAVETGEVPDNLSDAQASLLAKLKQAHNAYQAQFADTEAILKLPSMGILTVSHETSDRPVSLFATDIKTKNVVRLCLHSAHLVKATGEVVQDEVIAELVMSETQFADVVVHSYNSDGAPVTVETLNGVPVPAYDPTQDPTKEKLVKLNERINKQSAQVDRFVAEIEAILATAEAKGRLNKTQAREIADKLAMLPGHTVSNGTHDLALLSEELSERVNEACLDLHMSVTQLTLEHKE